MSWDEKIFQTILNGWEGLKNQFSERSNPSEITREYLDIELTRLQIFATGIAEESIKIRPAEIVSSIREGTLFLRRSNYFPNLSELNRNATLYGVIFGLELLKRKRKILNDFPNAHWHEWLRNEELRVCLSLLLAPYVVRDLDVAYPSSFDWRKDLDRLEGQRLRDSTNNGDQSQRQFWRQLVLTQLNACHDSSVNLLEPEKDLLDRFSKLRAAIVPGFPWREVIPRHWVVLLEDECSIEGPAASEAGEEEGISKTSLPSGTEKKAKSKETIHRVELLPDQNADNPLVHTFEKTKTADDYQGGSKSFDGSDELADHLDAIEELELTKVVRSRERTQSIYKGELSFSAGVPDLENEGDSATTASTHFYDEWDWRTRSYRKDWCRLKAQKATVRSNEQERVTQILSSHPTVLRELRLQAGKRLDRKRWRRNSLEGPEIDVENWIDHFASLRSGHSFEQRLYLERRPRERECATLLLLDSSLSTDAWVENHRVLDVLQESVLLLGEVMHEFRDRFAVGAFYSQTRVDCRYEEIKSFDQPWGASKGAVLGLTPRGYTRMGPALRHALSLFRVVRAKRKLLLLISDGKPTDYDHYEGKRGVEDVRQCVREAGKEGVQLRALAIDACAKFYLPQMFGVGNYEILSHPDKLTISAAKIVTEWARV